jgi:hypothetical protein
MGRLRQLRRNSSFPSCASGEGSSTISQPGPQREAKAQRLSLACSSLPVVVGAGSSTIAVPKQELLTPSEPVPSVNRLFVPIARKLGAHEQLGRGSQTWSP